MTTPLGNSGNSLAPKGLEDVIANQSAVCLVDGTRGRLLYRGYDIHDLAAHSTFEETEYLLMVGALPTTRPTTPKRASFGSRSVLEDRVAGVRGPDQVGTKALAKIPTIIAASARKEIRGAAMV